MVLLGLLGKAGPLASSNGGVMAPTNHLYCRNGNRNMDCHSNGYITFRKMGENGCFVMFCQYVICCVVVPQAFYAGTV